MFLSFFLPYKVRNTEAPYLWVFYKQITHFNSDEIAFIGDGDYFKDPTIFVERQRWETAAESFEYNEYLFPDKARLENYDIYEIDKEIFRYLEELFSDSSNLVWKELIVNRNELLENKLLDIMERCIEKYRDVEAVFSWCNCASLNYVAEKLGIKVIYNEVGPLRKPNYIHTAYFDFSGVNGNTESLKRYEQFQATLGAVPVFLHEELLNIFLIDKEDYRGIETEYDAGIALQVEDDSNVLAYANGLNNFELLQIVNKKMGKDRILIRRHPGSNVLYSDKYGITDKSSNSIEFIHRCEEIYTINSSVGIEAILHGKSVHILGDNPFAFLAVADKDEVLNKKMNFALLGYLIPYDLLFDLNYCRWRLSMPNEAQIYLFHLKYYLRKLMIHDPQNPIIDVIFYKLQKPLLVVPHQHEDLIYLCKERMCLLEEERRLQKSYEKKIGEIMDKIFALQDKEKELHRMIEEKDDVIKRINNSRGYKFLKKYYKLKEKFSYHEGV